MSDSRDDPWRSLDVIAPFYQILLLSDVQRTKGFLVSSNELRAWQFDKTKEVKANVGIDASIKMEEFTCYKVL